MFHTVSRNGLRFRNMCKWTQAGSGALAREKGATTDKKPIRIDCGLGGRRSQGRVALLGRRILPLRSVSTR